MKELIRINSEATWLVSQPLPYISFLVAKLRRRPNVLMDKTVGQSQLATIANSRNAVNKNPMY